MCAGLAAILCGLLGAAQAGAATRLRWLPPPDDDIRWYMVYVGDERGFSAAGRYDRVVVVGDEDIDIDENGVYSIPLDLILESTGWVAMRALDRDMLISDYSNEIYLELPGATGTEPGWVEVMQINAGATSSYTDSRGRVWTPDGGLARNGAAAHVDVGVVGTPDPEIFRTQRWHPDPDTPLVFSMRLPDTRYRVRLHFAETYFRIGDPGGRVFDVAIEGQIAISGYDIVDRVGWGTAVVEERVVDVRDGRLDIELWHGAADHPMLNGFEVAMIDSDRDAIPDLVDRCPVLTQSDVSQPDADLDGIPDECECGDFTGDGFVNAIDGRLIKRCAVGQIACAGLCDVTGDGLCGSIDASLVDRVSLGQIPKSALVCAERP